MNTIYRNNNNRIIGQVKGNTFIKSVKKSKHLFKKLNAWGIDKAVLEQLLNDGVENIEIKETEEKKSYKAKLTEFNKYGEVADFGHGVQVFLSLSHYNKN
jgi:hypothetical protein